MTQGGGRREAGGAGALLMASLLGAALGHAQSPATGPLPCEAGRVRAGTLCRLVIQDSAATDVVGEAAGEPLHFARDARGRWFALVPVHIDSSALQYSVRFTLGAEPRSSSVRHPLREEAFPSERLRVDPRFGAEPDAALRARIEAEGRRAAEVARAAHDTPRLWEGDFAAPRPGRVTSGFGRARVFNGRLASRHMGTDFAGAVGAPVRTVNRGVVRIVGRFYYGGNVVYVDHGAGLVTAYLHLSATSVAFGDTVAKGQVIGRVGATGRVTGPHLHLIARYGAVTVDPMSLLPGKTR